ncbi:sensor domain-containing diguanylate cyclase [Marinomonas epiphytica]
MKSVPLRRLIVLPFVFLVLISGIILYFVSAYTIESVSERVGLQYINEVENRVHERIISYMEPMYKLLEVNQEAFSKRPELLNELDQVAIRFHEQAHPFPQMTFISVATAKGEYINSVQDPFANKSHHVAANFVNQPFLMEGFEYDPVKGIGVKRVQDPDFSYDPRSRTFYQSALRSESPVWSKIERYYGYDTLGITLSAAVHNRNRELVAVTATSVALNELNAYLKSLTMVEGGSLFITELNGDLIASSTDEPLYLSRNGKIQRHTLAEHPDGVFKAASVFKEIGAHTFHYEGESYLFYLHPISLAYGETWILGIIIPNAYHQQAIGDYAKLTLLITFVLFLCISVVGVLVARYIVKPIKQLNHVAHTKDLQKMTALPDSISRVREVEFLGKELKSMATNLSDILHNLEDKVAQRTQHLEVEKNSLLASALTDELTGIYNRRGMKQAYENCCTSLLEQSSVTLVLCDIDHFKGFNDKYGHGVGDQALVRVAKCLKEHVRAQWDIVARYGGEEFALIFFNAEPEQVVARLAEIRQSLKHTPMIENETISMSFGIEHSTGEQPEHLEKLIDLADNKLYQAKNSGRDKIVR